MKNIKIISVLLGLICLFSPLTGLAVDNPVLSMAVNGTITSDGSDMVAGSTLIAYCGNTATEVGRTVLAVDGQYGTQNTSLPVNSCLSGTLIWVRAISGSEITEKKATDFIFTAAEMRTYNIAFEGSEGTAVSSIDVTPKTASKPAGETQQFTATATYFDANTADITAFCTWESGTLATATIILGPSSDAGLATGVVKGTSVITATYTDAVPVTFTDTADLTVSVSIPTGLSASAASTSQINLSWTAMTGATSYKVYRNSSNVGSPTTNSYSDTGLTAGTAYSYTVSAVNTDGETSQSSSASATTESAGGTVSPGGGGGAPAAVSMPTTTTGDVTATKKGGGMTTITTAAGGEASVKVPAYAVSANTKVSIESKAATSDGLGTAFAVMTGDNTIVGGYVYEITATAGGSDVTEFSKKFTITLTYTDTQIADLSETSLTISYWDTTEQKWFALPTTVDKATNTLTAKTDHLTYFAIVVGEEGAATPVSDGEMTQAEIRAAIAEIIVKIKQLQAILAQMKGETVGVDSCSITSFDRSLKRGMSGSDVKCLQLILNSATDTQIASSGVGSPGQETNYFGGLTKAGVIKFQEKYTADVLSPHGLTSGTGYVGTTTRAKLNTLINQ